MGRLIGEDELIKGRVENDPVVIAAKCTFRPPTMWIHCRTAGRS